MALVMAKVSHSALVKVAARWLASSWKCGAILTETGGKSLYGEMPDAIGWRGSRSIVIECKVSRSDFLADRKKPFRQNPKQAMGAYRFYLAPKGLLTKADVEGTGWGLLETVGKRVQLIAPSQRFQLRSLKAEVLLMYSALQRVQYRIALPLAEMVAWKKKDHVFEVLPAPEE